MIEKETKIYTMMAYKYDGKLHYEQPLELYKRFDNHIVLKGRKGRELIHHTRNSVFKFDKKTYEYFFSDRWYTAAIVVDDNENVVHIYCNIALPCVITDDSVEFTDLDVDVIVTDGNIKVIDLDEFEDHKIKYGYSGEMVKKVFIAVDQVKSDIMNKEYPFNRNILVSY